jgi:ribonuclease P/MRP protein subunit RPP25
MAQTTQSKYVPAPRSNEQPEIQPNEVRITTQGLVKRYVDYASSLLQPNTQSNTQTKSEPNEQKIYDTIILRATGRAINQAIKTAEVVKRRIGNLHQITNLETLEIKETWEPTEEGLKPVETIRRVASITIRLSRKVTDEDKQKPGYQEPIPAEQINSSTFRGRGRGRFRGNFGGGFRGRGRGRGFGRGSYSGTYNGTYSGTYSGRGGPRGGSRGAPRGGGRGASRGTFIGRGSNTYFRGRRGRSSGFQGRGRGNQ